MHSCLFRPRPVTESGSSSINVHPMRPTPNHSSYIEDGYNIILTAAPKDLGGRLFLNLARTIPLLPINSVSIPVPLLFLVAYRVFG